MTKMKYRILLFALSAALVLGGCKGGGEAAPADAGEAQTAEQTDNTNEIKAMKDAPAAHASKWAELGDEPMLTIQTTHGTMTVRLYSDTPLHRDNFVKLAKSGFYDGLLFHRIIPGFMIQGGDPYTRDSTKIAQYGSGGPGYTVPAEIVAGRTHKKGALAAARRGDPVNPAKESSGSQFYIVQDADGCRHLDGEYTVFGEVVEGLDVVDKIAAEQTDMRDRPLNRVAILSVRPAE